MSQSICHNCLGRGVKDNCEGNDGIALDMAQKICHKRYVTSSIYGPCCKHKETLPRKGDGSPEERQCMRLQQSHIKCHTMYMSQCICHRYLGKVVMRRRETE